MSGNESRIFDLAKNSLFSLLSLMDSSIISVKNARFNLKHHSLKFGVGLGVSNQVVRSPLEIELDLGLITLIVEHDE